MIGKTIAHYKILEKLGDGGMGEVYLAEDTKLKRKVALKFLPKEYSRDSEAKKRFMSEARSASSLDHSNICVIHDINETEDGQMFISMNYCKGETLQNCINEREFTIKQILQYITQIAKGLEKAHDRGIVHCDIKPSNIIITNEGIAKIVDFGIARIVSEEKLAGKDGTSGTVAYMSPEHVSNSNIDARSDIWSLGVVFYEILTKQAPFNGSYNDALMYSIINEEPVAITNINPDISAQLDRIIVKMMKKNPDDRYQNISELLKDLKSFKRQKDIPVIPLNILKFIFNAETKNRFYLLSLILTIVIIATIAVLTINSTPYVPSIGILNMENLGDPKDEFWSRGITEDLIINVASAGVIRVPTINEINKYNGLEFSIEKIAEMLRVDYLLSSSLFKKDSTFDLWCRIIEPRTGKDIFARKWSKPIQEASTITTILAGTVLNNLGISSAEKGQVPVIIDPDAYEYYLKGKNAWEKKTNNNDIDLARALLNKALEIDQNFLLAKMQLGQTFMGPANYSEANKLFSESLLYANKIGDEKSSALAMFHLGNVSLHNYKIDEAIKYYNDALKIVRKYDDKYFEMRILRNIGGYHYYSGDLEQAKIYFIYSRDLSATLNDLQGEGEALYNLGSIYLSIRDYKSAIEANQESYDIFKKIENKSHIVSSLVGLSYASMGLGKIEDALQYAEASLNASREISDKRNEIYSLSYIGEINYFIGNYDLALDNFLNVSDLSVIIGENYYSAVSNQFLGQIMSKKEMYDIAIEYFAKADSFWKILNEPSWSVWTASTWAFASLKYGDIDIATKKNKETEAILKDVQPYEDYATCVYYNLYNYFETVGDTTIALQYLSLANDEMNDRIKFIDKEKDKRNYIDKIVIYRHISNKYKQYFE